MALRGFVDLQVNGFRDVSFTDPELTEEATVVALRGLIADGTAIYLPTVTTNQESTYAHVLPLLARICKRTEFAQHIPGLHLEGPFLCKSDGAAGAHNPAWMSAGDTAYLDRLQRLAAGMIRLITIAPDIAGAEGLIRHARKLGIVVSLGHHLGTAGNMDRAAVAGATCLTHLGNGLPHLINRHLNPLIEGMADDRYIAMIIGDGHHVPWSLVKTILAAKGLERCALVSDASCLAGMPPGTYQRFGATAVIDPNGRLYTPATGYLWGSSYTIRKVVNATQAALKLDDQTMHRLAVVNPLKLIGLPVPTDLQPLARAADGAYVPIS
ncbi:MAG: hypothetical protein AAB263_21465 [Planctomycetota bacterium]